MRIYLVTPTGGTVTLTGPSRFVVAASMVQHLGYSQCSHDEWKAARKRQQAEEYGRKVK